MSSARCNLLFSFYSYLRNEKHHQLHKRPNVEVSEGSGQAPGERHSTFAHLSRGIFSRHKVGLRALNNRLCLDKCTAIDIWTS